MTDTPRNASEEDDEKQPFQFAKWSFRVLYSPMKTFEEVVKKPGIKGPILILLLTLPLVLAGQYTIGGKVFIEEPTPKSDLWTEKPLDSTLFSWSSNGNLTFDSGDAVVGNFSVSAFFTGDSLTWVQLTDIGSLNCSDGELSRLFLRLKLVNAANMTPTSARLHLSSLNEESRVFQTDLADSLTNIADSWANVSVDLASGDWTAINSPTWTNITGIRLEQTWTEPPALLLKIDGLFFGKYSSLISSKPLELQIPDWLARSLLDYLLRWLILSAIVFLALRSLSEWKGSWSDTVLILGYVFSVLIIYQAALTAAILVLPPIHIPYNITYSEYLDIYQGSWGTPISVLSLIQYGWSTILCTVAARKSASSLSWNKAFLVGFGAVIMSLILSSILGSILLSAFS